MTSKEQKAAIRNERLALRDAMTPEARIEGSLAIEGGRITYRVVDAKGEPVIADDVSATFKRPVDEREDFTLALEPVGPGLFVAERAVLAGQWVVDIGTTRGGEKVFHQTLRLVVSGGAR